MTCPVCHSNQHSLAGTKNGHDIHYCDACACLFVDPMPSQAELDAFYQDYHKTKQYAAKLGSKVRRATRRIWWLGRKREGRKFLDVGCNVGFAVEAARKLGYDAVGIDVDCKAVETAGKLFPKARFKCGSLEKLASDQERFDLVYCSEVIEHLPKVDDFLQALRKVMNEGAILYLTTPDVGHFSLPRNFQELMQWNGIRPPEHLIYFSRKSMKYLLHKHGFQHVRFKLSLKSSMRVVASVL